MNDKVRYSCEKDLLITNKNTKKHITIAFDEWNTYVEEKTTKTNNRKADDFLDKASVVKLSNMYSPS